MRVAALLRCSAMHWFGDQAATTGAALAFYCAFSLGPLLVIVVSLASHLIGSERAYDYLDTQLASLFGYSTARVLLEAMQGSRLEGGGLAATVSAVSLFIGATTVFSALRGAIQQIFGGTVTDGSGLWSWVRTRVLSFGIILAVGFLLLVSLTLSTAVAALRDWLPDAVTAVLVLMSALDLMISVGLTTVMIALIYRFMPDERLSWRAVITGASITAVLFQLGRWAVALYLAHTTQPSAFGAAASFVALLLWLYYTAQIFLFGAELTACMAGLRNEQLHAER